MNDDRKKAPSLPKELVEDLPHIESEWREFTKEFASFLSTDQTALSRVLRAHLIVEHYLSEFLVAANPAILGWEKARLTFPQKLRLAAHPATTVRFLEPGLDALNAARNRLVHNLDVSGVEEKLGPIVQIVTIWNTAAGKAIPTGIDVVEEFASLASAMLRAATGMIQRHAAGVGLAGLLRRETSS